MVPRTLRLLILAAALVLAALPTAAAASDTRSVEGPFSSTLVAPPGCTSPIGICTHGLLTGDLEATYDFTMETLFPVGDPNAPNKFLYTGESVITDLDGGAQMFSHDTGVLFFEGASNPFVTTAHIDSGTKQYADATGTLVASGTIDFVSGQTTGSYTGSIDK